MKFKISRRVFLILLLVFSCFLFLPLMVNLVRIENRYNNGVSLLITANLIPFLLLFLFLLYDSGILNNNFKSYFDISDDGAIHIPVFSIYFSIFESTSINLVNNRGLDRLIDLELFSLEIDTETKSLRIFLFSKSKKSHQNKIEQSLPLLEAIFPNIQLLPPNESKSFLTSYSLAEIAGYSLIRSMDSYLIPVQGVSKAGQFEVQNKIIFTYNSSEKGSKKPKNDQTSQIYTLSRYQGSVDFNFLANLILKKNNSSDLEDDSKNKLLRAIIRFQLNDSNLISFQKGVTYIQKTLSVLGVTDQSYATEDLYQETRFLIKPDIESEAPIIDINNRENPICLELCNIHNNLEIDEKNRSGLCSKRVTFCKKLLKNKDFISLLMEITKKEDDMKNSNLLSELLVHLSFHQIYCLIAQFIFMYEGKDIHEISIQLLHCLVTNLVTNDFHQDKAKLKIPKSVQDNQTVIAQL